MVLIEVWEPGHRTSTCQCQRGRPAGNWRKAWKGDEIDGKANDVITGLDRRARKWRITFESRARS